jgi:hypothetical protein
MKICPECYSNKSRVTPIIKPEHCLKNHRQYICKTCGRCICAEIDNNGRYRAAFPFKSLEIAKYYLRAAEVINKSKCEIYELINSKKRVFYKIFKNIKTANEYLNKNQGIKFNKPYAVYKSNNFKDFDESQYRMLSDEEVKKYLNEKIMKNKETK